MTGQVTIPDGYNRKDLHVKEIETAHLIHPGQMPSEKTELCKDECDILQSRAIDIHVRNQTNFNILQAYVSIGTYRVQ